MATSASRAVLKNSSDGNHNGWAGPISAKPFPHVKDLIAFAQPKLDPSTPLTKWLSECEDCLKSAKSLLDFGRPDHSFRNYITASEIGINIIPSHKDYGFTMDNNQGWRQRYRTVLHHLKSMEAHMSGVRQVIEDNNARYATLQQSNGLAADKVEKRNSQGESSVSNLPDSLRISKARPASVPKPDSLKGNPMDLSSRFNALRTSGQHPISPATSIEPGHIGTVDFSNGFYEKPAGPREMPPVPGKLPSVPPKIPVDVPLPKPPSPTYSPTVIQNGMENVQRPNFSKKPTYYDQPISSTVPPQLQRTKDENPYRPRTPNGYNTAIITKSRSSEIPHRTLIEAETLAVYLKKYNVLLVDIRERTQFDDGHIFATSIICIEPLSLKEGVSAEDLEERLILSPENEQHLFTRIDEFDIVVYYDLSTDNDGFLKGPPTHNATPHLRAFYDTLREFNEYKPLKDGRPPALLQGGLDAWTDLMSVQSLARSKTAVMLGSTRQRAVSGTIIGRRRIASTNSRWEIRNRRLQNHKFLDEQEQAAWREKAEQEQVSTDQADYSDSEPLEEQPTGGFVADYESFLRRFPAVDRQSMVVPQSRPPIPRPPIPQPRYEPPGIPPIPSKPPPAIPRPSYSGQHDVTAQAPLARVASSVRQPLYNSAISTRTKKIPKTGLTNFGVTCYMNSTLQCLSCTIPLAEFFMDEPQYKSNIQQNWKGSNGIMPDIFANVVRSLWKGDVQAIKPTTFRNFCGRMNREWVIDRQQDAKEFLEFLVDCLHEDLNLYWQRTPLRPLTTAEEIQREKYSIAEAGPIEWNRYQHRDYSFMSSLFAGQHASRLKCQSCRNTSTTYEAFYSISIEIPKQGNGDIYQCLRSYTQEERLSELWKCPYCNCERQATKQIILTRLPQFLVIHFKRFSASKTERARKIHTPIEFPLHGLSMDPFIVPGKPSPITATDSQEPRTDPAITAPFSYDAYGVLRHLGNSGDGGHYISIVKDPGRNCWRKFDDERHTDLDPARLGSRDRLQNGEAYIVFYQRALAR